MTDWFFCAGPFDLAKQMGVERGGEEHEAAIARILKAAKGAGKTAAFFCEWTLTSSLSSRYCGLDIYIYIIWVG